MTYLPITTVPLGEIYASGNATATIITTQNIWTRFDQTTTFSNLSRQFDSPQSGRLRYIGINSKIFDCSCCVSMSSAGNNEISRISIFKNGTVDGNKQFIGGTGINSAVARNKLGSAGDNRSATISGLIRLSHGEYMELAVQNASSTNNLTIRNFSLHAMGP